ncbi:MAG: hypothetical protein AAF193_03580, partial [Bacteroidota bacterium]
MLAESAAFIGINPRTETGLSGNANVKNAHFAFADFDPDEKVGEKIYSVDRAKQRIVDTNLPEPHIVIDSGRGVHAYWRLDEP